MFMIDINVNCKGDVGKITEFKMPLFEGEDEPLYINMRLYGYIDYQSGLHNEGIFPKAFTISVDDEGILSITVDNELKYSTYYDDDTNMSLIVFVKYKFNSYICYFGKNFQKTIRIPPKVNPMNGKFNNDMALDRAFSWYVYMNAMLNDLNDLKGYPIEYGRKNVILDNRSIRI